MIHEISVVGDSTKHKPVTCSVHHLMNTSARKMSPFHLVALAAITTAVFLVPKDRAASAWAQSSPAGTESVSGHLSASLTFEQVQAKIQEIDVAQSLDDPLKAKAIEFCQSTLVRLETVKTHSANATAYTKSIDSAPQETERIAEVLRQPTPEPHEGDSIDVPSNATSKDLEQRLATEQAELANLKTKITDLEQQIKTQQERPEQAREQLAKARQSLIDIDKDLGTTIPKDEPPLLTDSRRMFLASRKQSRSAEINMLEQELLSHSARLNLLKAQRDLVARQLSRSGERVDKLQTVVNEVRRNEAEKAGAEAEKAKLEAVGKHPTERHLAEQNAELAKDQTQLAVRIEQAITERRGINEQLAKLDQEYTSAREKLEIAGLSDALGPVLREQRKSLPDMRSYRKNSAQRQKLISEYGLEYLKVEGQRRELGDIQNYLERLLREVGDKPTFELAPLDLRGRAVKLLEDQRELLNRLAESYGTYLSELGSLNFEERQLVERANRYATFLDEKLLWIPSAQTVGLQTFDDLWQSLVWATSPRRWTDVGRTIWCDSTSSVLSACLTVLVCGGMLSARRRLKTQLDVYSGRVGTVYADNFWLTIGSLGAVVILAAPIPFVFGYMAWRLQRAADATDFARAVGVGLATAASFLFILELVRHLCRDKGVARVHFRWRAELAALFRRNLHWVVPVAITTGFVVTATEWQVDDVYRRGLGRLAFMVGMLGLVVFIHRVFLGHGGIYYELVNWKRDGWLSQLFWFWYPLIFGTPLLLTVLAAIGYYYAAYELAQRFLATVCVFGGLVFTNALVLRWLFVARQKLEITRAREKREASASVTGISAQSKDQTEGLSETLEFPEVTIEAVDEHTRRLLRALLGITLLVALWMIWSPILPAFRIFDNVELWHHALTIDGQEVLQTITLTNLTMAVLLAIITAIAARNLPGVMELAVLQRLPLAPGSRYAIATSSRYLITMIGVVLVFNAVGIGWSKVQWLVAALGVGLGFGLQEIVANFVSGLIILFERPIRVGDTVTVGTITGTVSRVQIRATTITDWDRKELIVPNKEFVTGQLINWSLSDAILRLVLRVGVAYGSNTKLTRETLLAVAMKQRLVLKDPAPSVIFYEFGDSSLNFDLRVYVPDINDFIQVRDHLHMAIDEAFQKAGIVIAFPQRDMHMDTTQPLEVHVIRERRKLSGDGETA